MTERGQPIDVAPACPFVAFDDERDERSDRPDARHRCYAETPPSALARAHQEQYCLSAGFASCPIFRIWARREAARVAHPSVREEPDQGIRGLAGGTASPHDAPRFGPPPAFGAPPDTARPAPDADVGRPTSDLPPRPIQQGSWSQPPPWLHSTGGPAGEPAGVGPPRDDDDRLDQLVGRRPPVGAPPVGTPPVGNQSVGTPPEAGAAESGRGPEPPGFLTRPAERGPGAGLAGSIADESAAAALASRLAAIGMSDEPGVAPPPVRPAAPVGSQPLPGAGTVPPSPVPPAPVRRLATPDDDIIGARVVREPGASGGLSRILRLGRAPEPAEPRSGRGKERSRGPEPNWERPRRAEAYPAIRSRVGVPGIPRALIGLIALALAAAFLFFVVPPFFLGDNSAGPGASVPPSGAIASRSPGASRTPAPTVAPTPRVYVVRSGDTLSTIATRFGLTVDEILEANPAIKNPNQIAIVDRIVIPTKPAASGSAAPVGSVEPSASGG